MATPFKLETVDDRGMIHGELSLARDRMGKQTPSPLHQSPRQARRHRQLDSVRPDIGDLVHGHADAVDLGRRGATQASTACSPAAPLPAMPR